jgi:hypothetical protein
MARRCQGLGQVVALNQPHVEVEAAVDLAEVMDGDDVGVGQPGSALALLEEAPAKLLVPDEPGAEPLKRDDPLPACVVGSVGPANAAPTDQVSQLVGAE